MDSFRITRRDVDDIEASLGDARDYLSSRARSRASAPKGLFQQGLQTLEVCAAAGFAGLLYGRYGDQLQKSPIPLDLALGVVGHTLAIFDVAGSYDQHLHAVSDGFMASFFTKAGIGYGTTMRANLNPPLAPVTLTAGEDSISGALPAGPQGGARRHPLTEAEHAARAHRYAA